MHPVQVFELIFIMLLAILALHWIALRLKLPPAVALLIGGGALAFVPGLPVFELDPELVLVLFLPPLLMDGAFLRPTPNFAGISRASCRWRSAPSSSRPWSSASLPIG